MLKTLLLNIDILVYFNIIIFVLVTLVNIPISLSNNLKKNIIISVSSITQYFFHMFMIYCCLGYLSIVVVADVVVTHEPPSLCISTASSHQDDHLDHTDHNDHLPTSLFQQFHCH